MNLLRFWRKSEIKGIQELETEVEKLKFKINAKIIAFLGVGGKVTGLNLISCADNDIDIKLFAGMVADFYQKIIKFENEILNENLFELYFNGYEKALFLSPITDSVVFTGLLSNKKDLSYISNWIEHKKSRLKGIFSW